MKQLFLSESDLDEMGLPSRSTRWRERQEGRFPEPVMISKGRIAYRAEDIEAWIADRRTARQVLV